MTDYVRGANPIWYLVDLDGVQFDDNCYLWVLENEVPYLPAQAYHTPTGTPWTNPIQFEANGTLPTDIYYNNGEVYRLEFRKNDGTTPPSQSDELVYLIENYSPTGDSASPVDVSGISTENQLANPQFAEMSLTLPYALTGVANPDPIEIAPGWFLELTGNGTVDIERVSLNNATQTSTNAPYALRITLGAGWTSLPVLRQRLSQNGMLWSEKYVASSLTARIEGAPQSISARLDASDGAPLVILQVAALENDFTEFTGTALVPQTTNADLPPNAYIDFKVLLPTVADIYITSLQLVTLSEDATVSYQQDSIDRQIDHLFHYYKDKLIAKPIPSYLTGWDFTLNPAQFTGSTVPATAIGANKSKYVWDQTIIFQSVDSGIGITRSATTGGIIATQAAVASGQCAFIQYLPSKQAREILSSECSVALSGLTTKVGGITGSISLWATSEANLPVVAAGTNNSIILTIDANGKPATTNGTWTEITRLSNDLGTIELGTTQTELMLSGFDISDNALVGTATFFAIVIGFEAMAQNDTITLDWVSLCKGSIATHPAPQSFNNVLQDCEYYYEKSYATDVTPGTAGVTNQLSVPQHSYNDGSTGFFFQNTGFSLNYKSSKRAAPNISFYAPAAGTLDSVTAFLYNNGNTTTSSADAVFATYFTAVGSGNRSTSYSVNSTLNLPFIAGGFASAAEGAGWLTFHYVIDARLGIVN